MSKVGYEYDELGSIQGTAAPVSHDNDNYSATFRSGRANLSSVKRYDVTNTSLSTVSHVQYNTTGAVVTTIDPEAHQTSVSYADSFSDGNNSRNTLAYPTTGTDADNFSTTIQYNFDFGARTRMQGPPPQNQPQGMIQTFSYDAAARIKQVTTVNNSAYTRYVYGPDYVQSFATVNTVADEAYSSTVVDGLGRTVLTAQNHPGSVGGYSSKNTLYDVLGQTTKQSNPTETNGSFNPAGDDAAGWLYTQQTYDWKGRPLVTTNTDSTTKEASYAGCGCAGGEVVTLTDEGTIDAGVAKRRQQKIYSDILGRQVKTEVLNWQGGSVYATTVNTYNARDQIKLVRQYQGDESSAVYQDTVMTYDGYARLKTKHVPEQDANTATTYNYNSDDTPLSVVDARGSSATFTHNARRLVTHVSYDPSAGIADTPDVSIGYDAAGNRISMSDGLGSMSYGYDQLSRLTSETRTFTSVGTFPLNYSYNLANQLTSVNDQAFSTTMGYAYDLAGRLNQLTGSGYPNVSQFASNIQYRAWGAVKAVSYGNGTSLSTGYNSRLLPASFSVPGAISKTYQYYSDGRLDYSQDVDEPRYDRKSGYDQVGRLTKALSGAEARGLPATEDRPYNESYQQDVWGNLTNRTSQQWARSSVSEPAVYTNNRRSDWHYDAGGNWLDDGTYNALQRKYDAAGRLVKIEHPAYSNNPKRTDDYDGDGDRLRTGYHQSGCSPEYNCPFDYTYYLRSTALGGQIISEVRGNGQKAMGYIYYPNGTVIAVQKLATPTDAATYLLWRHTDPSNSSVRASDSNGWTFGEYPNRYNAENDPLGADNGLEDPGELSLATAPDDFAPQWLVPSRPAGKCRLDGMPIDCSDAMEMLDHGTANVLITLTNGRRIEAAAQSLGVGVFRFYIDGKDLKGDSGGYTGKTVVDDKDGHAYEVMDQTTNSTNGRWETFSFNSRPRPNNSGFDQNKAGGGRLGRQPCATMADYAQNIADSVKGSANPLLEFDTKFAAEYLGRFPDNITGRPMRTFADVLHYSKGGGTINRGASGDQEGQADFLPGFYEQSSRGDAEDQTHHFAAYFSLGINNRRVSQTMAKRLDSSGGKKDKDLGSAAFSIGRTLQRDPSLLANIGDTILRNICRP
jgi:YD repeat-containing protein